MKIKIVRDQNGIDVLLASFCSFGAKLTPYFLTFTIAYLKLQLFETYFQNTSSSPLSALVLSTIFTAFEEWVKRVEEAIVRVVLQNVAVRVS